MRHVRNPLALIRRSGVERVVIATAEGCAAIAAAAGSVMTTFSAE